jgi:hypothetical protein
MVRYLICATLLVITAAAHAQSSTDHVVISLKREYGRALYTECRLSLVVFRRQGRASLWCALNTAGGKSLRAERQLTPQEAGEFPALVAAGKLCSGGHLGRDDTASDGILETLQTRCSEGDVAVLVTSGNPTFKTNDARRGLLDRLHILEEQLRKAAPLPK